MGAKKKYIKINKSSERFSEKIKNLHDLVDYTNNKNKEKKFVYEVESTPPLDNNLYPKIRMIRKLKK
jgi:hypothetical protein